MAETADELVGEVGVVVVVYGADDLVGVPGGADLAVRGAGVEQAEKLVASGLVESFVGRLGHDLQGESCPIEIRSLGRTILRWKDQIAAWHRAHVTQGPTEGINNLIKRVKRAAFAMTNFANFRIRALLYAGKPNWDLLATLRPR